MVCSQCTPCFPSLRSHLGRGGEGLWAGSPLRAGLCALCTSAIPGPPECLVQKVDQVIIREQDDLELAY